MTRRELHARSGRRVRVLTTAALLLGTAVAAAGQTAGQPTFPVRVEAVTIDAVVLDRQGKPIEGLTRDDFTVREDGQLQTISTFEAVVAPPAAAAPAATERISTNTANGSDPRWFFVVFDDVNISAPATPRARDAVLQFIEGALVPGDRIMIAAASGGSSWTGVVPRDADTLKAFVRRLEGQRRLDTSAARIWDHEAMAIALGRDPQALSQVMRRYISENVIPNAAPSTPDVANDLTVAPGLALVQARARQTYTEAAARIRLSLAALERTTAAMEGARGRKTLLLVSEGFIADPTIREFRGLVRAARRSNVAIHFVDAARPGGAIGQSAAPGASAEVARAVDEHDAADALRMASRESDGARSIAVDTGGSIVTGTNLMSGLVRIAAEGRSYYLLGYQSTNNARDGKFRRIEVSVSRSDVDVRARSGYFAPGDDDAPLPAPDTLDPAVRAALDAPGGVAGIPLRLAAHVFGPADAASLQTLLVAEADLSPLRMQQLAGRYSALLDSYVVIHRLDGGPGDRDERLIEVTLPPAAYEEALRAGLPIRREFRLPPGRYQATLALQDRATRLVGSVRHEFEVPPLDEFRISTPVVTDTLQREGAGGPARPVPVARRTFIGGTRLVVAFEVYGAQRDSASGAVRLSVGYQLLLRDGTIVTEAPPRPVEAAGTGAVPVLLGVTLPSGSPQDFDFVVSVHDRVGARTLEARERVSVTVP